MEAPMQEANISNVKKQGRNPEYIRILVSFSTHYGKGYVRKMFNNEHIEDIRWKPCSAEYIEEIMLNSKILLGNDCCQVININVAMEDPSLWMKGSVNTWKNIWVDCLLQLSTCKHYYFLPNYDGHILV